MFTRGIHAIYKPVGPTSFDVVARLRKLSNEKRIGHAGTLDPFASGVLVVAIGREFTKQLSQIVDSEKEYIATVHLGVTSSTDDPTGELTPQSNQQPDISEVKKVLSKFIGIIQQLPPIYSSIKIKGKPAHRRVRAGQKVELEPREVEVKSIELLNYSYPLLSMKVVCSKGVYIRSLARDIGVALNVGAYLETLERTRVGQYTLKDCQRLENFN